MRDYKEFLKAKEIISTPSGFECDNFNQNLYDWQKDIVRWALMKGKACLFEQCGLGKTIQQLEFSEKVCNHIGENAKAIILAPLAVTEQTRKQGIRFGYQVNICENDDDVKPGINITNYEQIHKFDTSVFCCVVLDESSILKDFTSSTKNMLVELFNKTPYKLCCTATPAPNDYTEIGNHTEFLGVMRRAEMLSTFFMHDGGETSKWALKAHAKKDFFRWVASWACCITTPADIGYDGSDYELPELHIFQHEVKNNMMELEDGQLSIIAPVSMSLTERRNARRESLDSRVKLAADIANKYDGQVLVWCDLNSESEALKNAINGSVEVKGSDPPKHKKDAMIGFSDGNIRCLVSKPSIAGFGMNWQNCNKIIFVGLSDSFEKYYQAVRRCWRYGQTKPVEVHIVISEKEGAVKKNIEKKQADAEIMQKELIQYTKDILERDIRHTIRETENYFACERMVIPVWMSQM